MPEGAHHGGRGSDGVSHRTWLSIHYNKWETIEGKQCSTRGRMGMPACGRKLYKITQAVYKGGTSKHLTCKLKILIISEPLPLSETKNKMKMLSILMFNVEGSLFMESV